MRRSQIAERAIQRRHETAQAEKASYPFSSSVWFPSHHLSGRWTALVLYKVTVLIAYLDETGHSADTEFVGVAGIVAPDHSWANTEATWQNMLAEHAVESVHMRELAHSKGQYKGWTEQQRRALLSSALGAVEALGGLVLGVILPMKLWRQTLTMRQRKALVDPYFLCLQEALTTIALRATLTGTKAKAVVAQATEFAYKAESLCTSLLSRPDYSDAFESYFTFAPAKEYAGLQIADMVSYEFLKAVRTQAEGKEPKRWTFVQLTKGKHHLHLLNEAFLQIRVPPDDVLSRVPGLGGT